MSKEQLLELERIVLSHHDNKEIKVEDDTNLIDDLGYDSVSVMCVIGEIEEHYGFEFEFEDLNKEDFLVYGTLVNIVSNKINRL